MATSQHFEADLPELTDGQLEKLFAWGQNSCEHLDVRMKPDMSMMLIATRKKQDSVRGHMRLLRTNLLNWGVALPTKQLGWLRLIMDEGNSTERDGNAKGAKETATQAMPSFLTRPKNLLTSPMVAH